MESCKFGLRLTDTLLCDVEFIWFYGIINWYTLIRSFEDPEYKVTVTTCCPSDIYGSRLVF